MDSSDPIVARRVQRRAWLRKRFPRTALAVRHIRPDYLRRQKRFEGLEVAQVFEKIYRENIWQSQETKSGLGSTLEATSVLRDALPAVLADLEVRSLLDLPCGDFHWMRHVELGLDRYIGADIVADLVVSLQEEFGDARRRFMRLDLCNDPLPTVDVILCRDVFLHLATDYIVASLKNVRAARPRYLMASTYPDTRFNVNIQTGMARPVNLCLPPIGLPTPLRTLEDPGVHADRRVLGVWSLAQLENLGAERA